MEALIFGLPIAEAELADRYDQVDGPKIYNELAAGHDELDRTLQRTVGQRGRSPLTRSDLDGTSATQWNAQTGYKALGLTVAALKDRIMEEQDRQERIRTERAKKRPPMPPQLGRILHLQVQKTRNLECTRQQIACSQPLLAAQQATLGTLTRIGDVFARGAQDEVVSWDRYGKAWHQQYGPARTVEARRVEFLRIGPMGVLDVIASVDIKRFSGNWLLRGIIEFLDLPKVRVPRELKPVQMGDHYAVEQLRKIGGVSIFRRLLAGETVDHCAVYQGETYHAGTPQACIQGLRSKLAAALSQREQQEGVLTAEDGLRLGFCEAGVRGFCTFNGLDYDATYTRKELTQVVRRRLRENRDRWATELHRAGIL